MKKYPKLKWYRRKGPTGTDILTCRVGNQNGIHIYKLNGSTDFTCLVGYDNNLLFRLAIKPTEDEGMIWGLKQINKYLLDE